MCVEAIKSFEKARKAVSRRARTVNKPVNKHLCTRREIFVTVSPRCVRLRNIYKWARAEVRGKSRERCATDKCPANKCVRAKQLARERRRCCVYSRERERERGTGSRRTCRGNKAMIVLYEVVYNLAVKKASVRLLSRSLSFCICLSLALSASIRERANGRCKFWKIAL